MKYEKGKYYFEYSLPDNNEDKLIIYEKNMELDSAKFYKVFFEKITAKTEIEICNKVESEDENVIKKGKRICETMQELCNSICKEINKQCF